MPGHLFNRRTFPLLAGLASLCVGAGVDAAALSPRLAAATKPALATAKPKTNALPKTTANSKTTASSKTGTQTASSKTGTQIATDQQVTPLATTRPTTPPKPLSARTALKNWDVIADDEWPGARGSITARAQARSIEVYRAPNNREGVLLFNAGRSVAGPVHFLALGLDGDWVRVAIPLRPNGTVGWVRRSDVLLIENSYRVVIELATNRLSLYDGDQRVIDVSVASGTGGTPTPTGLFFLKELVPQNPSGSLGPFAFGLSGYSDVLTNFMGGEGTIGIHGTNSPGKLGLSVSHGCVRVDNASIVAMARNVPLGTPVEVVQSLRDAPSGSNRRSTDWAFGAGSSVPAGQAPTVTVEPASGPTVSVTTTTVTATTVTATTVTAT